MRNLVGHQRYVDFISFLFLKIFQIFNYQLHVHIIVTSKVFLHPRRMIFQQINNLLGIGLVFQQVLNERRMRRIFMRKRKIIL